MFESVCNIENPWDEAHKDSQLYFNNYCTLSIIRVDVSAPMYALRIIMLFLLSLINYHTRSNYLNILMA